MFPVTKSLVSSEDTIFTFHMRRHHGCHDKFSLSQWEITITASRAFTFFIHKSVVLKNKMEFSNQLPNFDINIFDDEQNERIDGRFVPMTDSEVDNLIKTEENANIKRKTLYDINFFKQFLTEHAEKRSIEEIPAVELTNHLRKFILAARTKWQRVRTFFT